MAGAAPRPSTYPSIPIMFSIAEIEKIAELACLELTEEEKRGFAEDFESILGYFKIIDSAKLPVEGPAEQVGQEKEMQGFREDRAEASGVEPGEFSPYLEDGHFKVPKVIE